MLYYNISFFVLLQILCGFLNVRGIQGDIKLRGSCDQLLDTFAANTATFTYCAIRNARPITFCEKCVSEYISVLKAYEDIFQMTDETGQACRIKLLNLDRLEIIEDIFKSESELWKRGECDYCFETTSNGTLTNELRNTTKEFKRRHMIVKACISEHHNDTEPVSVCVTCRKTYQQLNSYYDLIKLKAAEGKDNDNVCMDIIDLMNATRIQWSRELHCIPMRQSQVPLFVSAALLLSTPVVFYAFSIWFSRRDRMPDAQASTTMTRAAGPASASTASATSSDTRTAHQ